MVLWSFNISLTVAASWVSLSVYLLNSLASYVNFCFICFSFSFSLMFRMMITLSLSFSWFRISLFMKSYINLSRLTRRMNEVADDDKSSILSSH